MMKGAHYWFDSGWFYAGIVCFALSLPPIFDLTKNNRIMNRAGDLTYPLYLTHEPLITALTLGKAPLSTYVVAVAATIPLSPIGQFAVIAIIGSAFFIVVAYVAHVCLEKPVTQLFAKVISTVSNTVYHGKA